MGAQSTKLSTVSSRSSTHSASSSQKKGQAKASNPIPISRFDPIRIHPNPNLDPQVQSIPLTTTTTVNTATSNGASTISTVNTTDTADTASHANANINNNNLANGSLAAMSDSTGFTVATSAATSTSGTSDSLPCKVSNFLTTIKPGRRDRRATVSQDTTPKPTERWLEDIEEQRQQKKITKQLQKQQQQQQKQALKQQREAEQALRRSTSASTLKHQRHSRASKSVDLLVSSSNSSNSNSNSNYSSNISNHGNNDIINDNGNGNGSGSSSSNSVSVSGSGAASTLTSLSFATESSPPSPNPTPRKPRSLMNVLSPADQQRVRPETATASTLWDHLPPSPSPSTSSQTHIHSPRTPTSSIYKEQEITPDSSSFRSLTIGGDSASGNANINSLLPSHRAPIPSPTPVSHQPLRSSNASFSEAENGAPSTNTSSKAGLNFVRGKAGFGWLEKRWLTMPGAIETDHALDRAQALVDADSELQLEVLEAEAVRNYFDRMIEMHSLTKEVMGCNYRAPVDLSFKRVLENGCSAAEWSMDMASECPEADFIACPQIVFTTSNAEKRPRGGMGAHLSQQPELDSPQVRPRNCTISIETPYNRLSFPNDHFDFVYQRRQCTILLTTEWQRTILELFRVTKKGGWVELLEPNLAPEGGGELCQLAGEYSVRIFQNTGRNPQVIHELQGMLESAGFVNVSVKVWSIPLGWGGAIGKAMLGNQKQFIRELQPIYVRQGHGDSADYRELTQSILKEAVEKKAYVDYYSVIGQKPTSASDRQQHQQQQHQEQQQEQQMLKMQLEA